MNALFRRSILVMLAVVVAVAGCSGQSRRSLPTEGSLSPEAPRSKVSSDVALSVKAPFSLKGEGYVAANGLMFSRVARDFTLAVTRLDTPHSLQLKTSVIRRANQSIAASGEGEVHEGDVVRTFQGIEERVTLSAEGAEETWRFDRKPEGAGELAVHQKVSAHGEVIVGANSVRFVSEHLRVSEGRWIDARGEVTRVPVSYREGEIVFTVPEATIEHGAYPAVLDPTVSNETEIDSPTSTGAATQRSGSFFLTTSAFDGTNYVIAWGDSRGLQPAVMATRISQTGTVLDPDGILVSYLPRYNQFSYPPGAILFSVGGPGGFLVMWNLPGLAYYDTPYAAARIRSDGTVVDRVPLLLGSSLVPPVASSATVEAFFLVKSETASQGKAKASVVRIAGVNDSTPTPVTNIPTDIESTTIQSIFPFALADNLFIYTADVGGSYHTFTRHIGASGFTDATAQISALPADVAVISAKYDGTNFFLMGQDIGTASVSLVRLSNDGRTTVGTSVATPLSGSTSQILRADAAGVLLRGRSGVSKICRYTSALVLTNCANDPTFEPAPVSAGTTSYMVSTYVPGSAARGTQPKFGMHDRTTDAAIVASKVATSSANSEWAPTVAYDKTLDRYVAVWLDDSHADDAFTATTGGTQVVGAVIQPRGDTADVGPVFPISSLGGAPTSLPDMGMTSTPKLVQSSAGLFVVWQENRTTAPNYRIFSAKITPAANNTATVTTPIALAQSATTILSPTASADNSGLVVAWINSGRVEGKRVPFAATEAEALAIDPLPLSSEGDGRTRSNVTSVFDGKQTVFVWIETEAFGARLEGLSFADGVGFPSSISYPVATTFTAKSAPRLASDGETGSLLVWAQGLSDGSSDVLGKFLPRDALRPTDTLAALRIATQFERDEVNPSVAYSNDGESYFVAWGSRLGTSDSDVRGSWIARDGRVLDPEPGFVVSSTTAEAVANADGGKAPDTAGEDEGMPSLTSGPTSTVGVIYGRVDRRPGYVAFRARFRTVNSGLTRGTACTSANDCASRFCSDGVCCDSACSDGCGTCGGAGAKGGAASAVRGVCAPLVASTICANEPQYICGGTSAACTTICTGTGQGNCAPGYSCFDGKCTTRGSACLDDQTAVSATGNLSCGAYHCVEGSCLSKCKDVSDCTAGNVCDFDGRCGAPPPIENTDGCSTRSQKGTGGMLGLVVGAALFAMNRRRRKSA